MSIGDFPKSLSQAILVGIMLVGRLGVLDSASCCWATLQHTGRWYPAVLCTVPACVFRDQFTL